MLLVSAFPTEIVSDGDACCLVHMSAVTVPFMKSTSRQAGWSANANSKKACEAFTAWENGETLDVRTLVLALTSRSCTARARES